LTAGADTASDLRLGVLAFGDSITNGGGELQWGVALQSWALWVARALGMPYSGYAVDGARLDDVLEQQIPAFERRAAHPDARYDVGCLYIGVNDVRGLDWDAARFAAGYGRALRFLAPRCARVLAVTAPAALGIPSAGARVAELNAIVREASCAGGALVVDLSALRARNQLMADRVHPTAFGQLAIAERALAVLACDGLEATVAPASLISFQTTRCGRLRGDWTYLYRSAKNWARAGAQIIAARAGRPPR
jgi:lysophospholipase L1-like esterase